MFDIPRIALAVAPYGSKKYTGVSLRAIFEYNLAAYGYAQAGVEIGPKGHLWMGTKE